MKTWITIRRDDNNPCEIHRPRYGYEERKIYYWHKRPCVVIVRPTFKRGHKRNCAIKLLDTDEKLVVPFRALRKNKKYDE